MTLTSRARIGRAFAFTAFALSTTALTLALPTTAVADTKKTVTANATFFAKRSQGRSTNAAAATVDADSRAAGSNSRGRSNGSIVDELPAFDLADTTPEALEAADPDTRAALMAEYRAAREALFAAAVHQEESHATYTALRELDEAGIAAQFPDGGHAAALAAAKSVFIAARQDVVDQQHLTRELLMVISDGKDLSDGAVHELHVLLGV